MVINSAFRICIRVRCLGIILNNTHQVSIGSLNISRTVQKERMSFMTYINTQIKPNHESLPQK